MYRNNRCYGGQSRGTNMLMHLLVINDWFAVNSEIYLN